MGGGSLAGVVGEALSDVAGRAGWLVLVAVASLAVPPLLVRVLGGRRPGVAAPEVASLERDVVVRRRAATSPLIGDVQL